MQQPEVIPVSMTILTPEEIMPYIKNLGPCITVSSALIDARGRPPFDNSFFIVEFPRDPEEIIASLKYTEICQAVNKGEVEAKAYGAHLYSLWYTGCRSRPIFAFIDEDATPAEVAAFYGDAGRPPFSTGLMFQVTELGLDLHQNYPNIVSGMDGMKSFIA